MMSTSGDQVTAVCVLRSNAAICCEAHQPMPQTPTPSLPSRVGISADILGLRTLERPNAKTAAAN
jgi:hypothetical protein